MTQASKMRKADPANPRVKRALMMADRAMPGFASAFLKLDQPIRVVTSSVSCKMGTGGRKHRRYRRTHPPGPAMVKANHPFTKTLDAIARQFGKRPNRIPHYHTPEQMRAHDLSLRCRFARKHRGAHQQDPFTGNVKPCPICNPAQARTIAETGASTAGARAILAMAVERKLAKKEQ